MISISFLIVLLNFIVFCGSQESEGSFDTCFTPGGFLGRCKKRSECPGNLLHAEIIEKSVCVNSTELLYCCPVLKKSSIGTVAPIAAKSSSSISQRRELNVDNCGKLDIVDTRIIAGEDSLEGQFPFIASVYTNFGLSKFEFVCGATLITLKHVLSAAHCFRDFQLKPIDPELFIIRLGVHNLTSKHSVNRKVKEIRSHPRFFREGYFNDIAIVVLSRSVPSNSEIIPICLPSPNFSRNNLPTNESMVIVGWGLTELNERSNILKQATLSIWDLDKCQAAYNKESITENFICAGNDKGQDTCNGDSGGPLMAIINSVWTLIGIVSTGYNCGDPKFPGLYTYVPNFLNFIEANLVD